MQHLVFVYGTLKLGGWNHRWLNGAPCLGEARTLAQYSLYAEQYPFLVKGEPRYQVVGELYAIDSSTLAQLDELEGHPHDYVREEIAVIAAGGGSVMAWAYFHAAPRGVLLVSGVYRC